MHLIPTELSMSAQLPRVCTFSKGSHDHQKACLGPPDISSFTARQLETGLHLIEHLTTLRSGAPPSSHLDGLEIGQEVCLREVNLSKEHVQVSGLVQTVLHLSALEVLHSLRGGHTQDGDVWRREIRDCQADKIHQGISQMCRLSLRPTSPQDITT